MVKIIDTIEKNVGALAIIALGGGGGAYLIYIGQNGHTKSGGVYVPPNSLMTGAGVVFIGRLGC